MLDAWRGLHSPCSLRQVHSSTRAPRLEMLAGSPPQDISCKEPIYGAFVAISLFSCIYLPLRMPPSDAGEWWELLDEARDIPYYYHTKTKETQWTRPEGFVIPLNIIQVRFYSVESLSLCNALN